MTLWRYALDPKRTEYYSSDAWDASACTKLPDIVLMRRCKVSKFLKIFMGPMPLWDSYILLYTNKHP